VGSSPSIRAARAFAFAACLAIAAVHPALRADQSPPPDCGVSGIVASARTPLPGVVVSILDEEQRAIDVTASAVDGSYALRVPGAGHYVLKADLSAFAPTAPEVAIDLANCRPRVDLTMTLASRAAPAERTRVGDANGSPAAAPAARPLGARTAAFQSLSLRAGAEAQTGSDDNAGAGDAALLLPRDSHRRRPPNR
jgi:hypothetical protein